jgi:hypothetical protein
MIDLVSRYQLTAIWVFYVVYVAGVFQVVGWMR